VDVTLPVEQDDFFGQILLFGLERIEIEGQDFRLFGVLGLTE
jgi:hypothetical protein